MQQRVVSSVAILLFTLDVALAARAPMSTAETAETESFLLAGLGSLLDQKGLKLLARDDRVGRAAI